MDFQSIPKRERSEAECGHAALSAALDSLHNELFMSKRKDQFDTESELRAAVADPVSGAPDDRPKPQNLTLSVNYHTLKAAIANQAATLIWEGGKHSTSAQAIVERAERAADDAIFQSGALPCVQSSEKW